MGGMQTKTKLQTVVRAVSQGVWLRSSIDRQMGGWTDGKAEGDRQWDLANKKSRNTRHGHDNWSSTKTKKPPSLTLLILVPAIAIAVASALALGWFGVWF